MVILLVRSGIGKSTLLLRLRPARVRPRASTFPARGGGAVGWRAERLSAGREIELAAETSVEDTSPLSDANAASRRHRLDPDHVDRAVESGARDAGAWRRAGLDRLPTLGRRDPGRQLQGGQIAARVS